MVSQVHADLKQEAGLLPAAFLSIDILTALTVQVFRTTSQSLVGRAVPAGNRSLSGTLVKATFTQQGGGPTLQKAANAKPEEISLALFTDLAVTVNVHVTGSPADIISEVDATFTNLMLVGHYESNQIVFNAASFASASNVTRTANADALLMAAGVNPLEAARVEGLIEYASIPSSVSQSLGQTRALSLSDAFPAFDFGTAAKLVPLSGGAFLGIIPSAFTRVASAACDCAAGPYLGTSPTTNTIGVPANPVAGTQLGGVKIGGPIPQNIDPMRDLGPRRQGQGVVGVYMPKPVYTALTVGVWPALEVHAQDNGFIGFDARATVGFPPNKFNVALDAQKGGVILTVGMDISVNAICTMDIGCGQRLPIGEAIIIPQQGSQASLEIGFYPSVDSSGALKLRGVLNKCDMGSYVAIIIGVGTALEVLGVTAWIGFLIDVVLSAVVSYEFPRKLKEEIQNQIGQNEWLLVRLGGLAGLIGQGSEAMSYFDIDADSVLASTGIVQI